MNIISSLLTYLGQWWNMLLAVETPICGMTVGAILLCILVFNLLMDFIFTFGFVSMSDSSRDDVWGDNFYSRLFQKHNVENYSADMKVKEGVKKLQKYKGKTVGQYFSNEMKKSGFKWREVKR